MFKGKLPRVLALIAVFLVVFYSVIWIIGVTTPLDNALGVVATPFRWVFSAVGSGIGGFGDYFSRVRELEKENDELAKRIAELELKTSHVDELEGENAWMRDFLGVKEYIEEYELTEGKIIGRETNSYMTLYVVNKGSVHGVKKDSAVVSNGAIVGKVEAVGLNYCKVSTVIEDSTSVSAMCARSGAVGIVDGSLGLRSKGNCAMNYINEFADVEIGDKIISSGAGSVYPYGFNIGTVVEKTVSDSGRSVSAVIKPDVDFDSLTRVMILVK